MSTREQGSNIENEDISSSLVSLLCAFVSFPPLGPSAFPSLTSLQGAQD
jgi:hypothetical protein